MYSFPLKEYTTEIKSTHASVKGSKVYMQICIHGKVKVYFTDDLLVMTVQLAKTSETFVTVSITCTIASIVPLASLDMFLTYTVIFMLLLVIYVEVTSI